MEHREHQNLHALAQLMDTQFLKKVTQLLLSVSVFSFFFSHQYSLLSLLHTFNFYFAKFPYKLVTHTIDKNCIFLLCNGLVVFVAKYSGLIKFLSLGSNRSDHESFTNIATDDSPPDSSSLAEREQMILENSHDESFVRSITHGSPPESSMPAETKEMILDKEIAEESIVGSEQVLGNVAAHDETENECLVISQLEKETEKAIVEDQQQERGSESIISNGEEEEEEETDEIYVPQDDEEEQKWSNGDFFTGQTIEEEEEVDAKLSTEELNKKFDEFIRKMKAEIRIEAQSHLIMV
ncbi:hypothetical protein FNV43_RR03760 [Rhamnella rubrinervis]|uniref:Uncharacterized protein n=1 Tax=Rhamnella rubrinervis TaxID=2594499 RepID=A0A8K0MPX6_9ROSA|nr:hypothetical protein FNV43_RR03760 [Rhamnella rubrinervis]